MAPTTGRLIFIVMAAIFAILIRCLVSVHLYITSKVLIHFLFRSRRSNGVKYIILLLLLHLDFIEALPNKGELLLMLLLKLATSGEVG